MDFRNFYRCYRCGHDWQDVVWSAILERMGEKEEIKKRVENYLAYQERLNRERESRIKQVNQTVLRMLDEMRREFSDKKV